MYVHAGTRKHRQYNTHLTYNSTETGDETFKSVVRFCYVGSKGLARRGSCDRSVVTYIGLFQVAFNLIKEVVGVGMVRRVTGVG